MDTSAGACRSLQDKLMCCHCLKSAMYAPSAATAAPLPAAGLPGARVLRGVVCVCVPSFGVDTCRLTNTTLGLSKPDSSCLRPDTHPALQSSSESCWWSLSSPVPAVGRPRLDDEEGIVQEGSMVHGAKKIASSS